MFTQNPLKLGTQPGIPEGMKQHSDQTAVSTERQGPVLRILKAHFQHGNF